MQLQPASGRPYELHFRSTGHWGLWTDSDNEQ